jgi:hypothetical protein
MKVMRRYMCDFLGYEIKERLRMKKLFEEEILEEEPELENAEEQPISPYNHYKPIISYIFIECLREDHRS